jgi:hypothetical protein
VIAMLSGREVRPEDLLCGNFLVLDIARRPGLSSFLLSGIDSEFIGKPSSAKKKTISFLADKEIKR